VPSTGDAEPVVDNAAAHRFEIVVDGERPFLDYRHNGERLVLVHTEVPGALGGRGLGRRLVETAVRVAAAGGLTVVPICPFAASWLRTHPEVADLVTIDWPKG
jgi:predicted GNAT family acetyltransferase